MLTFLLHPIKAKEEKGRTQKARKTSGDDGVGRVRYLNSEQNVRVSL